MLNRPQIVPTDPEKALLWRIANVYHELLADVATRSSVPEAFLAALIANESGGRPEVKHFEPHVMLALTDVLLGKAQKYGSIAAHDLLPYIDPAGALGMQPSKIVNFPVMLGNLADLATSWGLTQIMGYEAVAYRNQFGKNSSVGDQITFTVTLLTAFARGAHLDLRNDFEELFDCWNTGRPHAATTDPQYIPRGIERMKMYSALLESAA